MSSLEPFGSDYGQVVFFDCETNIKNRGENAVGSSWADPADPRNKIVAYGWFSGIVGEEVETIRDEPVLSVSLMNPHVLVAHNCKFDLHYLLKTVAKNQGYKAALRFLEITTPWDTMTVEYILTGQMDRMISLESLCKKLKIPFEKDRKIKEYWANGVDTSNINWDELEPYLKDDVRVLRRIYANQYLRAAKMGMLPLILSQMKHLKALTVMEYSGMYVDDEVLITDMTDVMEKANDLEEKIYTFLPDWMNIDSPKLLSTWLYGGERKEIVDRVVLDKDGKPCYYKSGIKKGKIKTRKETDTIKVDNIIPTTVIEDLKKKDSLDTSEETLKSLHEDRRVDHVTRNIIYLLLRYRALSKEYKTYYVGVGKLIWDHDNCIHGNLNTALTATGRLSSSSPNLQNMPGYTEE